MPYKARKPCGRTGCGELTYGRFCEKHQAEESKNYNTHKRNQERQEFYDSPRWRKLRKIKMARDAFCEICKRSGRAVKAQIVDHIVEIEDGGQMLALDNLQSLCRSCHSSKSMRVRHNRVREPQEQATQDISEREYRF